ncbi:MAG: hypothetical protein WAN43_15400 [Rhodomicrobium sp.]|jgi:hypothetical protein
MALWTTNPPQHQDKYAIVYLLKDALRSALLDAWFFERTALPKADVRGAGHAEIAARLGRFRDGCQTFREREALMLTKLTRARAWAAELRRLTSELHHEIDQFLESTAACGEMQAEFVPDAQRRFNGGNSLLRFLARRKPLEQDSDGLSGEDACYRVGGRTALFELRAACEVFLSQIDEEFFPIEPEEAAALTEPLAAYLEAPKEPPAPAVPEAVH